VRLTGVRVALAPRRAWEALDLGITLLMHWRWAVYLPWLVCMLPLTALLCLALQDWPILLCFVVLWLKPLTDRVVLFVLSRAVFGPVPSLKEVLAELPRLFGRRLYRALVSQRLTMRRNLVMPVDMLEAPRGNERAARLRVLGRGDAGGTSSSSLVLFAHFQIALTCSILMLLASFGPESWSEAYSFLWEYGELLPTLKWHWTGSYLAAWLLLEPAFVAAGFGLYLCRRTDLEGWDLELGFREMAQRIEAEAKPKRRSAAAARGAGVALMLAMLFGSAPPLSAQAQAQESSTVEAQQVIQEVLQGEEFHYEVTSSVWVPNQPQGSAEGSWAGGNLAGGVLTFLAWVALAVVLVFVVGSIASYLSKRERVDKSTSKKPNPVTHAFGLDLRVESLPADPATQARNLWQAGQLREALSLLYRCALADLVRRDGLQLGASDTEFDAAQRVAQLKDASKAAFFLTLTETWLYSAWGARLPARESGPALVSEWSQHFGGRA
jgi:hypothetical protein